MGFKNNPQKLSKGKFHFQSSLRSFSKCAFPDCTADEKNVHKAPLQVCPFTGGRQGGRCWTTMLRREGGMGGHGQGHPLS